MTGGRALGKVSPRFPLDLQLRGISALPATRMGRTTPCGPSALAVWAWYQGVFQLSRAASAQRSRGLAFQILDAC